jgi:hypothetical protein
MLTTPHYISLYFLIFPSSLTDVQYKYTHSLYIAFGSANNWLTYALAKGTEISRKAEIFIYSLMDWLLQINPLAPSDPYMGRTAPLTSRRCISNTYSTNIRTEYFKRAA